MSNKLPKVLEFEKRFLRKTPLRPLRVGDSVVVHYFVKEGSKMRGQAFSGILIGKYGSGISASFVVRKLSMGEGIEKKFFCHSPLLDKVEVTGKGFVRRAKLYFLRGRTGKKAKLKQILYSKQTNDKE